MRPQKYASVIKIAVLMLVLVLAPVSAGSCPTPMEVLNLSDVHFNPFADASLVSDLSAASAAQWDAILASPPDQAPSPQGQETNYALLISSLADMKATVSDPAMVLFTGDILAHHFHERYQDATGDTGQTGLRSFIKKTVQFVVSKVAGIFPQAPVYFTLGNNDSYNGDYQIAAQGQFLSDAGEILADSFLHNPAERTAFKETFSQGGYYSLALPGDLNTRVIGVNTVFFSVDYQDPGEKALGYNPADAQLDWLEAELQQARSKGEKVWLLSHIPPGINVFGAVHNKANTLEHMTTAASFWQAGYQERYLSLVREYSGTVAATLSGHTHMDDFRVVFPQQASLTPVSFINITPAISPQFGNNPGYKVFTVADETLAITDARVHYLNLEQASPAWSQSYSFNQAYGRQGMNPFSLNWIHNSLSHDQAVADTYMLHYDVNSTAYPFKPEELRAYWAGQTNFSADDYLGAYNSGSQGPALSSREFDGLVAAAQ